MRRWSNTGPMATIVNFDNPFEMPLSLQSLEDFRRWSHSGQFPETGRIDYVDGRIEVDMSPEGRKQRIPSACRPPTLGPVFQSIG